MPPDRLNLTHVSRPPRSPGSEPHPVLVLLHGYGADEHDLLAIADDLDGRFYVVSARAPLSLDRGYAWNHLGPDLQPDPATFRSSLEALTRFVDDLPRVYPVDPNALFTLGFSQGAILAAALLLTRPSVPRGTIMLSGYLPIDVAQSANPKALAGKPVFVGHGRQDPLIPVDAARLTRDYLRDIGTAVTYHEYPIAHYIGSDELRDVARWVEGQWTERPPVT